MLLFSLIFDNIAYIVSLIQSLSSFTHNFCKEPICSPKENMYLASDRKCVPGTQKFSSCSLLNEGKAAGGLMRNLKISLRGLPEMSPEIFMARKSHGQDAHKHAKNAFCGDYQILEMKRFSWFAVFEKVYDYPSRGYMKIQKCSS